MFTRWQYFDDVRDEMNRLYNEANRLFGRGHSNGGSRATGAAIFPSLNMWEDDQSFYVEAELPGMEMNELEILVTGGNQLTISGERSERNMKDGVWHRQERGSGKFQRIIDLPMIVDPDRVSAEFKNGVLTIVLAKREEVKPRRIEVKAK